MARRRIALVATLALVSFSLAATPAPRALAADAPPAPAAPPGPTFKNGDLGITVDGPSGWRLAEGTPATPAWATVATFSDAQSGSSAVLSVRRATAVTLPKLRAEVSKTFADDKSYTVAGITDLPVSGKRPLPGVLVDATQSRPADPPAPGAAPPAAPPPPTTWRVQAAFFLAGEREFQLYVQARATLFARMAGSVDRMVQSVTLRVAGSAFTPKGGNAFRDDVAGFACRYPEGYGVRLPDRTQHLVEFAPAAAGPVLGVYRYETEADLDKETELLVEYYKGPEVGGEATGGRIQVAGREAALVTAKGRMGGKDQVFFVAVVKRGNDTFRLRCAADVTDEAAAKATFDTFTRGFVLLNV